MENIFVFRSKKIGGATKKIGETPTKNLGGAKNNFFWWGVKKILGQVQKKLEGGAAGVVGGGKTNERAGTDHITSGLMRGLGKKKNAPNGANRHPDRQTDTQTWQLYD